eukprot:RCo023325
MHCANLRRAGNSQLAAQTAALACFAEVQHRARPRLETQSLWLGQRSAKSQAPRQSSRAALANRKEQSHARKALDDGARADHPTRREPAAAVLSGLPARSHAACAPLGVPRAGPRTVQRTRPVPLRLHEAILRSLPRRPQLVEQRHPSSLAAVAARPFPLATPLPIVATADNERSAAPPETWSEKARLRSGPSLSPPAQHFPGEEEPRGSAACFEPRAGQAHRGASPSWLEDEPRPLGACFGETPLASLDELLLPAASATPAAALLPSKAQKPSQRAWHFLRERRCAEIAPRPASLAKHPAATAVERAAALSAARRPGSARISLQRHAGGC